MDNFPDPHQIPWRIWVELDPTEQDWILSVYEYGVKGRAWDIRDVVARIKRTAPLGVEFRGGTYGLIGR